MVYERLRGWTSGWSLPVLNFVKNLLPASDRGKTPRRAQIALSPNQYSLKVQTSENILLQITAPKVPANPSYDKFCDFAKGEPREISQKSPKKQADFKDIKNTPAKIALSLSQYSLGIPLKCKHRRTFCCEMRLQKCLESRVMTNLARTPKSRIFCDFAIDREKGEPREFLKNRPKSRPTLGA